MLFRARGYRDTDRRNLATLIAVTLAIGAAPQASNAQTRQVDPAADTAAIKQLIAKYAEAVDKADPNLAAQVWSTTPDISFIHPDGQAHGWEQVKGFYTNQMGAPFSERKLTTRDITVHVYGDTAWAEFNWHFTAKLRSTGATVETDGRETQIYHRQGKRWVLVHVHYSGMPDAEGRTQGGGGGVRGGAGVGAGGGVGWEPKSTER